MQEIADGTLAGRRVLIVEDEYFLADDLRQILVRQGAEVLGPVATREDGLRLLADNRQIDFAILDMHLRDQDATAISAILRDRKIPFLFATGYDAAQIPAEYANIPRLEKPFDAAHLVAAINAGLERHAKRPTDACG